LTFDPAIQNPQPKSAAAIQNPQPQPQFGVKSGAPAIQICRNLQPKSVWWEIWK